VTVPGVDLATEVRVLGQQVCRGDQGEQLRRLIPARRRGEVLDLANDLRQGGTRPGGLVG
jgi:hypothetical protein